MTAIREKIIDWARVYVPQFNAWAALKNMDFYTQSPLNGIDSKVKGMIVGINPGCGGVWRGRDKTVEEFLGGNPTWNERFGADNQPAGGWRRYLVGVHTFMNMPKERCPDGIDDDRQYVWTNVTPFSTRKANEIPADLIPVSVQSMLELISILSPERIMLLGANSYRYFERYAAHHQQERDIYFRSAFAHGANIHIGRIHGVPCYCIVHPTGHWPVSHNFTTEVLTLLREIDTVRNGRAVNDVGAVIARLNSDVTIQKLINR